MILLISPSIALAILLAVVSLIRRSWAGSGVLPLNAAWIDELSMERYRPMMRLLNERDFAFLRSQPGFDPRRAAWLRAQRCRIFRGYVRRLASDFRRVCMAVNVLLLQAPGDRPDLAVALVRRKTAFLWAMAEVNVRVFLYRFGLGSVDVSALVGLLDALRLELRQLAPSAAGAVA